MRVTALIIGVNIAMYVYLLFFDKTGALADKFTLSPINIGVSKNYLCVLTSGFMHADITHLALNCTGIFIFGSIVESRFGPAKMMMIYFGALLLSMSFAMFIYTQIYFKNVHLIGASGAVMGLISCAMLSDPFLITYETLLPIPVMIKGWMFVYADMKGFMGGERDGISHLTHLLGFISIAVLIYLFDKNERGIFKKGLLINAISVIVFLVLSRLY